jgi:divalent metal cation (Fe/Co/Zn/Cd) transporter
MGQGQEGDRTLKSHRDTVSTREGLLRRGVWLEIGTVAWNAIEGIIAVAAGIVASSVALVGFGVDSFVETTSGAVVGWRLRAEFVGQLDREHAERLERRAGRIAGALLLGLSVYIVVDAGRRLLGFGPEAHESRVGMVLTAISNTASPSSASATTGSAPAARMESALPGERVIPTTTCLLGPTSG